MRVQFSDVQKMSAKGALHFWSHKVSRGMYYNIFLQFKMIGCDLEKYRVSGGSDLLFRLTNGDRFSVWFA
ncbi:hypothetical protein ECE50_029830 [Chitinophaga sp. Mgbs1]|uniref:Uncharacterized protein n=1 Tax=Chitinophaga solisilvae TaxID=1233460 RepID=A0A9Q5DCJ0_9BACT|nr:hypothetical protein [Chitinophaga solisilvae]